jgi:predicted dehydrogenase
MNAVSRRHFLLGAGAISAAGANNRVQVAVIGVRNRGRVLIERFACNSGSCVAAVCDIDSAVLDQAVQLAGSLQPHKPKAYKDLRHVLEDRDIDAVCITACNHWHALATIWACQAGKDVYVEKPASHNIWEGRRMVEAARKYRRIVQVGMQNRSLEHVRRAMDLLHHGAIGRVYMAKGLCYKRRRSIGRKPDTPVPPGVNYDLWLGPAPVRPFNPNRFHYNWHWFWDTGNGDIGNQGPHQLDLARWGLRKSHLPSKVFSTGGKYAYDDDQETPNTQIATFDYGDCQVVFEVRGLITGGEGGIREVGSNYIGNLFFGTEGILALDGLGYRIYRGEDRKAAEEASFSEPEIADTAPHVENFLQAVRSRNSASLAADILEGHLSSALCHLANISYRTGRNLQFDQKSETFPGDTEANSFLSRRYRGTFTVPAEV